jgi:hypothetical protein
MNLQELIDQLNALPRSARTANVNVDYLEGGEMGIAGEVARDVVVHAEYERGEVTLVTEAADGIQPGRRRRRLACDGTVIGRCRHINHSNAKA